MASTNKKRSLAVSVSQEELYVILAFLGTHQMAGVDTSNFQSLTKNQIKQIMEVSERALAARGFLMRGNKNKPVLNPVIFAVIGACAMPDWTLALTHIVPKRPGEKYYFHISRKMHVIHSIRGSNFHQFVALEGKDDLANAILSILSVNSYSSRDTKSEIRITQGVLKAASELALEKGVEKAQKRLIQGGVEPKASNLLATSLADPLSNTTFAYSPSNEAKVTEFAIMQGKETRWLFTPAGSKNGDWRKLQVSSVDSGDIVNKVKSIFNH